MAGERYLVRKVLLGLAAGIVAVASISLLSRAGFYIGWAEIIGAALIGAVAGVVEKSRAKIALGAVLGCSGWIVGEVVSRSLFQPVGAWIFVGGFIGLTAGLLERSIKSMVSGVVLGAIGGFVGVAAGISTMMVDQFLYFDMQAVRIISAGIFISLLLGFKRPRVGNTVVPDTNEEEERASSPDKQGRSNGR